MRQREQGKTMPDRTQTDRAYDLFLRVRDMLDWMPPNGPTRAVQDALLHEAQLAAGRRDVEKLERLVQQTRLLEKMLWDHRRDRLKAVEASPPPPTAAPTPPAPRERRRPIDYIAEHPPVWAGTAEPKTYAPTLRQRYDAAVIVDPDGTRRPDWAARLEISCQAAEHSREPERWIRRKFKGLIPTTYRYPPRKS
jgi:hypothetical protein